MQTNSGAYIADSRDPKNGPIKTVLLGGVVAHTVIGEGDAATKAADDWAVETIGAIQNRLGRRLSEKEIRRGLAHEEKMTVPEIAAQKVAHDAYFAPQDTDDRTPLERARDEYKAEKRAGGDIRLEMYDKQVAAEKADLERKAAKEKRDADPRVAHCAADSQARLLAALFDPDCTTADIRDCEFRQRVAKEGRPEDYERMTRAWQATLAKRAEERAGVLQQGVTMLRDEMRRVSEPFTLPATTVDHVKSPSVDTGGLQFSPETLANQ